LKKEKWSARCGIDFGWEKAPGGGKRKGQEEFAVRKKPRSSFH